MTFALKCYIFVLKLIKPQNFVEWKILFKYVVTIWWENSIHIKADTYLEWPIYFKPVVDGAPQKIGRTGDLFRPAPVRKIVGLFYCGIKYLGLCTKGNTNPCHVRRLIIRVQTDCQLCKRFWLFHILNSFRFTCGYCFKSFQKITF